MPAVTQDYPTPWRNNTAIKPRREGSTLTNRERLLAVIEGRELDRVPFVQYDGLVPNEEAWSIVGRDRLALLRWSTAHREERPNCRSFSEDIEHAGRLGLRTTLVTPGGSLTEERFYEPVHGSSSVRKHYVTEPEHYRALTAFFEDTVVFPDHERVERDIAELGDDGLPHVAVARTPFQQLWVQWVSLADLSLHLVDCPEIVEECIAAMTTVMRRQFEAVAGSPAPYIDVPDNITAPAIGERYFRRYCVPLYDELAGMLAERGKKVYVHMDGDLRALWKAIGESRVGGLDSMSPPPDNDTSVAEAVAMWPEMRIGINFPSSVHLRSYDGVRAVAEQVLAEGGHTGRFQIQISENVPPDTWRTSYRAIADACDAFGKP
jgi:hypothetical protein